MSVTVDGIAKFLNNSEGRDKLMKLHQYQGRMWMHLLKTSNPQLSGKFDIIFSIINLFRKYENRKKAF